MHRPALVTAPTEMPVSLQEVKQHLRLVVGDETYTTEDGTLQIYLDAAVSHLDGYSGVLGRCLVTQTWRQDFDAFAKCMRLPLLAATVASVKYRAPTGTLSTVASTEYSLKSDDFGSYVRFNDDYVFPGELAQSQAVLIEFTAGYGAAADVPAAIKAAILLLVGHFYINRLAATSEPVNVVPMAVDALITPFRRMSV